MHLQFHDLCEIVMPLILSTSCESDNLGGCVPLAFPCKFHIFQYVILQKETAQSKVMSLTFHVHQSMIEQFKNLNDVFPELFIEKSIGFIDIFIPVIILMLFYISLKEKNLWIIYASLDGLLHNKKQLKFFVPMLKHFSLEMLHEIGIIPSACQELQKVSLTPKPSAVHSKDFCFPGSWTWDNNFFLKMIKGHSQHLSCILMFFQKKKFLATCNLVCLHRSSNPCQQILALYPFSRHQT